MPTYPDAPRLDLVDDSPACRSPDPYRWLEDADRRARRSPGRAAQDDAARRATAEPWTTAEHCAERIAELLSAGGVGAPTWRGERQFFMRRDGDQEHAVL